MFLIFRTFFFIPPNLCKYHRCLVLSCLKICCWIFFHIHPPISWTSLKNGFIRNRKLLSNRNSTNDNMYTIFESYICICIRWNCACTVIFVLVNINWVNEISEMFLQFWFTKIYNNSAHTKIFLWFYIYCPMHACIHIFYFVNVKHSSHCVLSISCKICSGNFSNRQLVNRIWKHHENVWLICLHKKMFLTDKETF